MSGVDTLPELPTRGLTELSCERRQAQPPEASSQQLGLLHTRQTRARSPQLLLSNTAPVFVSPPRSTTRRSIEFVRLSRSELDHKEQTLSSLRRDNVTLQGRVRELEGQQQVAVMLREMCVQLAASVGCSGVDGVAPESLRDMLTSRVSAMVQECEQSQSQLSSCQADLERVRGELAATVVKVSSTETQLKGATSSLISKDAQIQQLKVELESSQQASARSSAMLQSLRQQLSTVDKNKHGTQLSHTHLQTEIGRLQKQLRDCDNTVKAMEEQLAASKEEQIMYKERAEVANAAYEEVWSQLADVLQLDPADSCDMDMMLDKVGSLLQDNEALRLQLDTVTHSSKAAELDAKANRETILRLVSQGRRHEKEAEKVPSLQEKVNQLEEVVASGQRERESLLERLEANKNTVSALERELMSKNDSIAQLHGDIESLRESHKQKQAVHQQCSDFYHDIAAVFERQQKQHSQYVGEERETSLQSADVVAMINKLKQDITQSKEEFRIKTAELTATQARLDSTKLLVRKADNTVEEERAKVRELEAQVEAAEVFREQLAVAEEKRQTFYKRLGRVLNLDSASCSVLVGDFAEDSLVVRAEQLFKMESQALQEKQSLVYSLQRKLKAAKQAAESKDLQVSLLQRKAGSLEERIMGVVQKEAEMNVVLDRGRKMNRQLDKLQATVVQQRETIARLRVDSDNLDKLKAHCSQLEGRIASLTAELGQVQQGRVLQAQQLAEARQRALSATSKDKCALERTEAELVCLRRQMEEVKERERQLSEFKTAVENIVRSQSADHTHHNQGGIVSQLETLLTSRLAYQERARNLEASLRELERGFRTSYQDTLLSLNIDTR